MKKKSWIVIVILILFAVLLVSYFAFLANREKKNPDDNVEVTVVKQMLLRDLEKSYPPTPKEVLKYYVELTDCFYNETYTDEEFDELAMKARLLYDEELNAKKTEEEYLSDLHNDVNLLKDKGIVVSGYSLSAATDVEYFSQDGYSWARLYCTYRLRQSTQYLNTQEVFILRQDADGHWKIFGFKVIEPDTSENPAT